MNISYTITDQQTQFNETFYFRFVLLCRPTRLDFCCLKASEPHQWCNGLRARLLWFRTKDYTIGSWCFSAKHAALRSKSKDWLARNQDNVSEWGYMSSRTLLFHLD
jgi:hypothetical protein